MSDDLNVKLDTAQVRLALERLRLALAGDLSKPMREIGRQLRTSTQLRFRQQQGPDGAKWEPSAAALERKGQTLRETGRLRNSITFSANHTSAEIGTNVVYARIHQFGGYAGRSSSRAGPVRRSRLPARPFLGASDEDQARLLETIEAHVRGVWEA